MLHVAFVRSPHAHAAVSAIDADAARALPGVVAVLTRRDLAPYARPLTPHLDGEGFTATPWPLLADGVVHFVGQAVAVVAADSTYTAADAREAVAVSYEPRPAVVSIDAALAAGDVLIERRCVCASCPTRGRITRFR